MVTNCPNCGAPVRHLTDRDICEYCGTIIAIEYGHGHDHGATYIINIVDGELVEQRRSDPLIIQSRPDWITRILGVNNERT